jgi:hypothetical protein
MKESIKRVSAFFHQRPYLEDLLLAWLLAFLICLLTCCSLSPLYPLNNYDYMNGDSNLFRYYAWLWLQGRTPYRDFYDHKGLYHLAVDALGLLIGRGSRYGIFFLEVLASSCNLFFLARAVRLLKGDEARFRSAAYLGYAALFSILGQGNSEGEWILPISTLFVYFYLRAIVRKNAQDFVIGSFFMGLEVGLAFNSRPLDALWGGMGALYFVIRHYREHEKSPFLLLNMLSAIIGCLIPFAIFYPIAYHGGYLDEMFDAMFLASNHYWKRHFTEVNVLYILNRAAALAGLVYALFLHHYAKKNPESESAIGTFFFTMEVGVSCLYLLVLGFFHYFQSGFTFFILAFLYAWDLLPFKAGKRPIYTKIAVGLLSTCVSVYACLYVIGYYTIGLGDFSYRGSAEVAEVIKRDIPDNEWKEGKVFAIDCDPAVYLDAETVVQERFCSYTYAWSKDNPKVTPEIRAYLTSSNHPDYLLVGTNSAIVDHEFDDIIAADYRVTVSRFSIFTIYRYSA